MFTNSRPPLSFSGIRLHNLAHFAAMLVIVLCGLQTMNAQNIINTVAGGGSVSGPATGDNADIPGPSNVIVDNKGNVYTVSSTANQVFKVDTAGHLTLFAGVGWPMEQPRNLDGQPATQGSLNQPEGIAVDSSGNIIIADTQDYLIRRVDTNGIMTTLAGQGHYCSPSTANCGDGNPATLSSALLAAPNGVATDAAGNVYIADTGDNRIRVVNMQSSPITIAKTNVCVGCIATIAGSRTPLPGGGNTCPSPTNACGDGGSAQLAYLNSPNAVAVDPLGYIFIADAGDHRIRVITPQGAITTYVGTGATCLGTQSCGDGGPSTSATLTNPWQLYVDSAHNLYIADAPTNRIRKVTPGSNPPSTSVITTIAGNGVACSSSFINANFCGDNGPATSAFLNTPHGFYGDSSGNFYIADSGDQRIRQMNKSKNDIITYAGGGLADGAATSAILGGDRDVTVDASGNLYILDTANNRVRKVTGGNITTIAGNGIANYVDGPAASANLNSPYGFALDNLGNVYIADTFNLVVRVLNTQSSPITIAGVQIQPGNIGTVAGTGKSCTPTSGCGDGGPATAATFTFPTKVSLDASGNFYVADQRANRVREVNIASGTITTLAGTGTACANPAAGSCGDGGPATSALLFLPYGVMADSTGNIFISDSGDNRIRVVDNTGKYCGTVGFICAFAFDGSNGFGPDGQAALLNHYIFPMYVALDSRDNLFVSGSSLYYVVQRIDTATSPIVNPVTSIAGWPSGSPKYYGFAGDGGPALGAYLNNYGVALDSQEDLFIADGGNNRVREVNSSSTQGLAPVIKLSPTSLTFPATPIGGHSTMSVTVTDTGDDDLLMGTPSISGPYGFNNQNPCINNLVAPDTNCIYQITFSPSGYGTQNGQAILNDNAFNGPSQTISLFGSGPNFSIAAQPNSLTVTRGNQGTSTITVTPSAGFDQPINLTVYFCPTGSSCTVNPTQLTPPGTTQSTLTVNVGSSTNPGTYNLTIAGTGVVNHNVVVQLTVQ